MINISNLPIGWAIESLNELCVLNPKHDKNLSDDLDVSFVPMAAVDEKTGTISLDVECRKLGKVRKGYTHFADGDVIFAKITPCMENGKSAVVENLCNGLACGSTEFYTLRSKGAISPQYLHPFLRQNSYINNASMNMTGVVGQRRVPKDFILSSQIPLPPLNEQKRIVAKIEALQTRSTAAKEELEAIKPLLDQFRQSVLASAFCGDLTKNWRSQNPDVEPAEVLLERIRVERRRRWEEAELEKMKAKGKVPKDDKWKKKYKEPKPIDVKPDYLLDLPDEWLWLSADECSHLITDGEHATPKRSDSGVYLLSARNILNGMISYEKVDFVPEDVYKKLEQRLKLEAGDVLMSCSGTVGRSCVAPPDLRCAFVRSVAILKTVFETGEYISLAIRSPILQTQIEKKKTQTAQSNIFQGRIKILAIPFAPLEEQKEIVRRIESLFKLADSIQNQQSKIQNQIETLNQSILAKAFRGELVPQDPNDEPASVLLEKIKADREKAKPKKKRSNKKQSKQLDIPGI